MDARVAFSHKAHRNLDKLPRHPLYVDTPDALETLLASMAAAPAVAIDTEFVREDTFYPRLCLVQLATRDQLACVDVLGLPSLETLLAFLLDDRRTKVLHSARQDLEIFFHAAGRVPSPVFDTQIAAAMLGHGEQVGYAGLVESLLGVGLDKSHARTDWARRPLSGEQIDYAANDVRYLLTVYDRLLADLEDAGRSHWPDADLAALTNPALYASDPDAAWRRVRNSRQLDERGLARLAALARWRETVAMDRDRPRRWILADDALLGLAAAAPDTREALGAVAGIPKAVTRRYADVLLEVIAGAADDEPPEALPDNRLSPEQRSLAKRLAKLLDGRAEENGLSPAVLASRRDLKQMVLGRRDLPVLDGWRLELVGRDLLTAVENG